MRRTDFLNITHRRIREFSFGLGIVMVCFLASCSKKVADTVINPADATSTELSKAEEQAKIEAAKKEEARKEAARKEAVMVAEIVDKVNAKRTSLKQVSGHVSLNLTMGKQSVKVSGELKMKRDNIVQLTLHALGLITVGRLELTPESLLVMDNINKRYVNVAYSEIPFLKDNGIDFYTFQAIFWDELFLPGDKGKQPDPTAFKRVTTDKSTTLVHETKNYQLSFLTNNSGSIEESAVKGKQGKKMTCAYQSWGNIKKESFPNKYLLNIHPGTQDITAQMDLSKLKTDDSWKGTPTTIDKRKFQQLTLDQILKAIVNAKL